MRDVPPISGAVIWARQIERQLHTYMKRVEDVLGKGWEHYAEGARLAHESGSFRRKLDTRALYEAWVHDMNRRDMAVRGRLFEVLRSRSTTTTGVHYVLAVNFDPQIITLFKEARNLLWLGLNVPHNLSTLAKDAKKVYPHAVSLMETVRTYDQTVEVIARNPDVAMLLAEYQIQTQDMISKGCTGPS